MAIPFIAVKPWSYASRAFELSRQFLFKWTVNWRFVGEDVFLSSGFSRALLALHASLLVLMLSMQWLHAPPLVAIKELVSLPSPARQAEIQRRVTPSYVLSTILSAVIVGCLCARSLHYQFYAYIAWSTPFLLWKSGLHPVLVYAIWGAQEWAWNVYPSSNVSSMVVVACLAVTVASALVGGREESLSASKARKKRQ